MLFHKQPTEPWERLDFLLLEAYQILQDESCPQCGNPIWICKSTDPDVQFKMASTVCYATRTEEQWIKRKQNANKNWEPKPGETWYPVPYTISGNQLPTRYDYLKSLVE